MNTATNSKIRHCLTCGHIVIPLFKGGMSAVCPHCGIVTRLHEQYDLNKKETQWCESVGRILYKKGAPAEYIYFCPECGTASLHNLDSKVEPCPKCPDCGKTISDTNTLLLRTAYTTLQRMDEESEPAKAPLDTIENGRPKAIVYNCVDDICPSHGTPFVYIPGPDELECANAPHPYDVRCPSCGSNNVIKTDQYRYLTIHQETVVAPETSIPPTTAFSCRDCNHMLIQLSPGSRTYACLACGSVYDIDDAGNQEKLGRVLYHGDDRRGEYVYTCQKCGFSAYHLLMPTDDLLPQVCPECGEPVPNNILLRLNAAFEACKTLDAVIRAPLNTCKPWEGLETNPMNKKPEENASESPDLAITSEKAPSRKNGYTLDIDLGKVEAGLKHCATEAKKYLGKAFSAAYAMGKKLAEGLSEKSASESPGEVDESKESDRIFVIAPTYAYFCSKIYKTGYIDEWHSDDMYQINIEETIKGIFNKEPNDIEITWYAGYDHPMKDTETLKKLYDAYAACLERADNLVFFNMEGEEIMNFPPFYTLIQLAISENKPVIIL